MQTLQAVFDASGPLARRLRGFVPRAGQRRMAERVAAALAERRLLLIEAGTGTGKTFGYLVPALLAGKRVLISTGTRTLQDQLHARDLPLLASALGRPARVALLKGRGNYLCRARLGEIDTQSTLPLGGAVAGAAAGSRTSAADAGRLRATLLDWAARTRSGDLAEVGELGETSEWRSALVSTRETCSGSKCSEFSRCHVFAARRAALEADLVVVNHHLLLADLALKEDGFGELLPTVQGFIIDEAHQLPELASEFFGVRGSSRQIEQLAADARLALRLPGAGGGRNATAALGELEAATRRFSAALGRSARVADYAGIGDEAQRAAAELGDACSRCAREWGGSEAVTALRQCAERAAAAADAWTQLVDVPAHEGARTVTVTPRGFQWALLPYDIAPRFRGLVDEQSAAWIFTSATLALNEDFAHFAGRLGLGDADTLAIPSPFDFERQALLYLPAGLPDPGDPGHTLAVLETAWPLLVAADGGAFLLFTSHRALQAAASALRARSDAGRWPLLVQGEAPREQLLRQFRASGHAVLLGTASFWEGVDVQGTALRLVVIDKLPFAAVDDPQVRARVEHITAQGGNPFREYQLPEAAMTLKQGVGRLIRSEQDRGVVVICDPRLQSRSYGRAMLAVLPPMRVVREAGEALALLRQCASEWAEEARTSSGSGVREPSLELAESPP